MVTIYFKSGWREGEDSCYHVKFILEASEWKEGGPLLVSLFIGNFGMGQASLQSLIWSSRSRTFAKRGDWRRMACLVGALLVLWTPHGLGSHWTRVPFIVTHTWSPLMVHAFSLRAHVLYTWQSRISMVRVPKLEWGAPCQGGGHLPTLHQCKLEFMGGSTLQATSWLDLDWIFELGYVPLAPSQANSNLA